MVTRRNRVQSFIRNIFRWGIAIPLWIFLVLPVFQKIYEQVSSGRVETLPFGPTAKGVGLTLLVLWIASTVARMFHILPEWQRICLLRLGKTVGVRGPGFFLIPPFIYAIAQVVDIRIMTYEVKATRTLTRDNVPVDVTAAVELEVEDPEKAAIRVKDYWKTTEWASMEALKSSIGRNDLRTLLSETEAVARSVKREIDEAAVDFGVNVRAVRITDINAPQSLIEELAVIARAERSARAKHIEARAEKKVAQELVEAGRLIAAQPGAMDLRQIQALLEISKEESSTIIIYPVNSLGGDQVAAATAGSLGAQANTTFPPVVNLSPPTSGKKDL